MTTPELGPVSVTPHAPLGDYYGADRRTFIRGLFDRTAVDYDRIEALASFGSGRWYRRRALERAGLAQGQRVVDVGVGTGLVASEAAKIVGDPKLVIGVDPSTGMLANARVPEGVTLLEGRAESIPLPDGSADFLSMGYALRHVDDLVAAFAEYRRVLVPGGRLCLLEITRPEGRIARTVLKLHLGILAPAIARLFGRTRETGTLYDYYWATIEACVPPATILAALAQVGFEQIERHVELGVFSEYRAVTPTA